MEALTHSINEPWVIGGNFNLVRFVEERRGGDTHHTDRQNFNELIDCLDLIDTHMSNQRYT